MILHYNVNSSSALIENISKINLGWLKCDGVNGKAAKNRKLDW